MFDKILANFKQIIIRLLIKSLANVKEILTKL